MGLEKVYKQLLKDRDRFLRNGNVEAVEVLEDKIDSLRLQLLCQAGELTVDDLFEKETDQFNKLNLNQ